MDVVTLIYLLLTWTIAGLIAAILFGKAAGERGDAEDKP